MIKIKAREIVDRNVPESANEYEKFLFLNTLLLNSGFSEMYDLDDYIEEDFWAYTGIMDSFITLFKRAGYKYNIPSPVKISEEYMIEKESLHTFGNLYVLLLFKKDLSVVNAESKLVRYIYTDIETGKTYVTEGFLRACMNLLESLIRGPFNEE